MEFLDTWALRARAACTAVAVCALACAIAASARPAGAASSSVTVTLDVASSLSFSQSCISSGATSLGVVQPDTTATTATGSGACQMSWSSSNDTSRLRMVMSDRTAPAMAKAGNSWSNGKSGNNMMLGIHAYDANIVFGSSEAAQVTRSNDGGSTWVTQTLPTTHWLFDIEPEPGNSDRWVVVGGDGFVASTANGVSSLPGNATWTNHSAALLAAGWPTTADVQGVAVIDATTWMVGGDSGWMARTTNGGTSWTVYQKTGIGEVTDIDRISSTEYVASTGGGGLARTTTSGVNAAAWSEIAPSNGDWQVHTDMVVADATHVYVASRVGAIFRWNGTTFDELPDPNGMASRLQAVASSTAAPATLWVSGDHGITFRSTDSGATWTRQHATSGSTMYAGTAIDGSTAWFGASNNEVVKTTNGGTGWSIVKENATYRAHLSIDADPDDGSIAVSVGGSGAAYRTTNKGGSWTSMPTGVTTNLYDVTYASSQVVWAVGEGGVIIRSTDGGLTWTTQHSTGPALRSVTAVDEQAAWAVGDSGTVLATTNGGATWVAQVSGTSQDLVNVAAISRTKAVFLGGGPRIRRTVDGGATWVAPTTGPNDVWEGLVAQVSGTYYAASYFGRVYRSTDSGDSWTQVGQGSGEDVDLDIAGNTLVMAGFHGNTRRSIDGGVTWTSNGGVGRGLMAIAAVDANSQYDAKNTGSIWDTDESALAANQISDYGGGNTFASGSSTSTFGICLQSLAGATVDAPWVVDGGTCTANDADPWRAVPTAMTNVASSALGVTGTATFVFGARPRADQPSGTYTAGVTFEAIAPAV
ncbi:MAG: hypothetical protein KDC46_12840 [Thermoleophilia bacterium]|nr:hypothetical protein [Thermoleophilia bacterium]